jgi:glycosyltransferase involved in cell wall biosynthesis
MKEILEIIWYIFLTVTALQLFFWGIFFARLVFGKQQKNDISELPGVSVVISAKNEYLRLKKFLPHILEQDYPNFEVIVVNHASTDETEYFLKELNLKYPHLKTLFVQDEINFFHGKKFPLSVGIKSAKNEIVLLTDADCYPASPNWIREMALGYLNKTQIVLGYGGYEERKGLLNKLIRYDTLKVALLYFSFARWGLPYMGVGRNLSYTKSLFYQQGGFMSHYKILSGDDDLFVNKAATSTNTKFVISPAAKTLSMPKTSFADWSYQKRRHLTTGIHYNPLHILLLGAIEISNLLFYITLILLLVYNIQLYFVLGFGALIIINHLLIIKKFSQMIDEKKLLLLLPLLEVLIVLIIPLLTILNGILKHRKWK